MGNHGCSECGNPWLACHCAQPFDAQATVEALQREVNTLNQLLRDNGLGQGEIDSMAAEQDALSAHQALVREIKDWFEGCTYECERCGFTEPSTNLDIYYMVKNATPHRATPTERGEDHSGDDTDMVQKGGGDGE